jgi:hypothetical protein
LEIGKVLIDIQNASGLLFAARPEKLSTLAIKASGSFTYLVLNLKKLSWRGVTMAHLSRSSRFLVELTSAILLSLLLTGLLVGQSRNKAPAEEDPTFHDYRGIQIGTLADEVRKKLGTPAAKSDEQDFYVFNDKETAQVLYDATHKVTTISVDFSSGATGVITPQQVFGADVESKPDGSKYKMVRYPKVGYWISYSRTAGDTPIVTVTMTKMPQ